MDRPKYIDSMMQLINDGSKFRRITDPIDSFCRSVEDKINKFLLKLKKQEVLSDDQYKRLHVTGSGPGILYGQPKIHKRDFCTKFQCRPILAAYNLASYKIAKFIVPLLSNLTTNQYTILNSTEFSSKISSIPNADKLYMTSLDIESLFTNIPLHETIEICITKLFPNPTTMFHGFSKLLFKTLLEHSVLNSFFIFDNNYYQQTEGMGMGSPLGPTFANIFMCHFETIWLNNCPSQFKPVHYFRYLDDTFVLFKDQTHSDLFHNYLNNQHSSIKFTIETENNNSLPFLDVTVERHSTYFSTSVFRKASFSGLGTSFFSYCCKMFKTNGILTLLHRAYNVCSSPSSFREEVSFLRSFFHNNGFPHQVFNSQLERFLSSKLDFQLAFSTVPKKTVYFVIPYFGHKSVLFTKHLSKLISEHFTHLDPKIILLNNYTINNIFMYKDSLPKLLRSSLVYLYSCPQNCGSAYVGSTLRTLHTRISEHKGSSCRTGRPLASPPQSAIRHHSEQCNGGGPVPTGNFDILASVKNSIDLRIVESLYIHKKKPNLNETASAFPLRIIG